ncbi:MAG: hypothetical protein AAF351_15000 [Pseudomonadota bacterium]
MDDLAKQLRADADAIDAPVSGELSARIDASLHAIEPSKPQRTTRPAWFLWASSLTGIAAALAALVVLNRPIQQTPIAVPVAETPAPDQTPFIDWQLNNAVLTQSLDDELDAIESDLKKAEQLVREDLNDIF